MLLVEMNEDSKSRIGFCFLPFYVHIITLTNEFLDYMSRFTFEYFHKNKMYYFSPNL